MKCPASILPGALLGEACADAGDGSELGSCIVAAVDGHVANLLDVEYADPDPTGPIADAELVSCQGAISQANAEYGIGRLSALTQCQANEDEGAVSRCPDVATATAIRDLAAAVKAAIVAKCTNAHLAALSSMGEFGHGCERANSTVSLARCEIAAHDDEIDALLHLLISLPAIRLVPFSVSAGTIRLRAALNGVDSIPNDIDLYLRRGTAPTTTRFFRRSIERSTYESLEVDAPRPGIWYALVAPFVGANVPFQLTITRFE